MELIGAFKPVGRKLGKGLLRGGGLIGKEDIPGVPEVVAMIPVAGPVLAAAAKRCKMAEKLFASKMGAQKREWAKAQLRKDLLQLGVEEKYVDELVSLGLLVVMRHAAVRDSEEPKPRVTTRGQWLGPMPEPKQEEPGKAPVVEAGPEAEPPTGDDESTS